MNFLISIALLQTGQYPILKLLIFSQHLKQNKHLQGDKKFILES